MIPPVTFTVAGLDGFESGTTKTSTGECIPAILRFSPLPSAKGNPDPHPSAITGVYASHRVSGAHLFANEHFEVNSGAIIAPPPGNKPPDCSAAAPSAAELWPPNHQFVLENIAGVTDPDGDPVSITINSIDQDEPVKEAGTGSGNTCPDATGVGTAAAQVRSERAGNPGVPGDGRVYHIGFTADDGKGGTCTGEVKVCVPHDQRPGHVCVDQGPLFDSTVCP